MSSTFVLLALYFDLGAVTGVGLQGIRDISGAGITTHSTRNQGVTDSAGAGATTTSSGLHAIRDLAGVGATTTSTVPRAIRDLSSVAGITTTSTAVPQPALLREIASSSLIQKHEQELSHHASQLELQASREQDSLKTMQKHQHKALMRSQQNSNVLQVEVQSKGHFQTTQTTSLSALHLMPSTTAGGLAPPQENLLGSTTQPFHRLASTTLEAEPASFSEEALQELVTGSERELQNLKNLDATAALLEMSEAVGVEKTSFSLGEDSAAKEVADPPTATAVPNSQAAFVVSGAGDTSFNGVYMPTAEVNSNAGGCSTMVWLLGTGSNKRKLYVMPNGAGSTWEMIRMDTNAVPYNGNDPGTCTPETATWVSVTGQNGGTKPTVTRAASADYVIATPAPTPAPPPPSGPVWSLTYYVVSGAGVTGFNGVYYPTSIVVEDQACERTYAKDGPTNTEYQLAYADNIWYFQSLIGGAQSRPYRATDDKACAPDMLTWIATPASGGPIPTVMRSVTATTTTTTTTRTFTQRTRPPAVVQTRNNSNFKFKATTAPSDNAQEVTTSAAIEAATTTTVTDSALALASNHNASKSGAYGTFSRCFIRLHLPFIIIIGVGTAKL